MFSRDPEKAAAKAARKAERKQQREEAAAQRRAHAETLGLWRNAHPAENTMNQAGMWKGWPVSTMGETPLGPVKGGQAEFVDIGAHKAWTATRLIAGAATAGMTAVAAGRKNKGVAVINVSFGNGAAETFPVKAEPAHLRDANKYVTAFNALAAQLADEDETGV